MTVIFYDDFQRPNGSVLNGWTNGAQTNGTSSLLNKKLYFNITAGGAAVTCSRIFGASTFKYARVTLQMSVTTNNFIDVSFLNGASTLIFGADLNQGNIRFNGNTVGTYVANQVVTFEFKNINYASGFYDGYFNGQFAGRFNFYVAAASVDRVEAASLSTTAFQAWASEIVAADTEPERLMLREDFSSFVASASPNIYGANWEAAVFRAQSSSAVTALALHVYRTGNPGTVDVEVRNVVGGNPGSTVLASASFNGNAAPSGVDPQVRVLTLSQAVAFTKGTLYAVVMRASSGSVGNEIFFNARTPRRRTWSYRAISTNAGSSWTQNFSWEFGFQFFSQGYAKSDHYAYYRFANSLTQDYLGANPNTPTITTTTLVAATGAPEIGAASLTTGTSRINLNDSTRRLGTFTIKGWYKTTDPGENPASAVAAFISRRNNFADSWFTYAAYLRNDGRIGFQMEGNGANSTVQTGTSVVNTGAWKHIAIVYDGVNKHIYVDGASDATPQAFASSSLYYGGNFNTHLGDPITASANYRGAVFEVQQFVILNQAMTAAEIAADYASGVGKYYQEYFPLDEGLVAYYALENNALDSTANALNGTPTGVVAGTGFFGDGYVFNGGDYVEFPNMPFFDEPRQYSVSGYFNISSSSSLMAWISRVLDGSGNIGPFLQFIAGGTLQAVAYYSDGTNFFANSAAGTFVLNRWYFVTVDFDGTNLRIYNDGVLVATSAAVSKQLQSLSATIPFRIGRNSTPAATGDWQGRQDEIFLYQRSLTPAEVRLLANQRAGRRLDEFNNAHPLIEGLEEVYNLEDVSARRAHRSALTNEGSVTFVPGKLGDAADFDSPNTTKGLYIDQDEAVLDYAQFAVAWTTAAWVRPEGNTTRTFSGMQVRAGGNRRNFQFYLDASNLLRINVFDGTSNDYSTGQTVPNSAWNQPVLTYDGASLRAYYNAALVLTQARVFAGSATAGAGGFGIGVFRSAASSVNRFSGLVDQNGVWRRTLTQPEITALYNSTDGLEYPFQATPAPMILPEDKALFFGGAL